MPDCFRQVDFVDDAVLEVALSFRDGVIDGAGRLKREAPSSPVCHAVLLATVNDVDRHLACTAGATEAGEAMGRVLPLRTSKMRRPGKALSLWISAVR